MIEHLIRKMTFGPVPVAHICNPSYSGGRDQEDYGSKPAQANSSQDPISKKPILKRADGGAKGVGLRSSPSNRKKKKGRKVTLEPSLKGQVGVNLACIRAGGWGGKGFWKQTISAVG
jgi:hypothetical protein